MGRKEGKLCIQANRSTEEKNRYLAGLYQVKKRNLAKETLEQYMRAIKSLAAVIDKPYTEMDELDIDYYLQCYEQRNVSRTGKKNQASTVNNERRYLSAFFTWLRKEKFTQGNPVELVEPMKEIRKPIDYFRPSQMEELREGCESLRDRAIVEVLRSTGARVGEIPQINREDLDWNTGDILILSEKSGKYRTLYVDEVARFHLKRYLDSRKDNYLDDTDSANADKESVILSPKDMVKLLERTPEDDNLMVEINGGNDESGVVTDICVGGGTGKGFTYIKVSTDI